MTNRKLLLILSLTLYFMVAGGLNVQAALTITNVSVQPNPFSPDNNRVKDTTTISFVISGEPDEFARIARVIITFDAPVDPIDVVPFDTGENKYVWDGSGLPEGIYPFQIAALDIDDKLIDDAKAFGSVIIDVTPPAIENVFVSLSPFSPNGDGINDITEISFDLSGTAPPEFGTRESRQVGTITLWIPEEGDPLATLDPPQIDLKILGVPFGVRLAPWPIQGEVSGEVSFKIDGSYKGAAVSSDFTISSGGIVKLGANVYDTISGVSDINGPKGYYHTAILEWFTGNAVVNIYSSDGKHIQTMAISPIYNGDRLDYHVRWGPKLSYDDGVYIYRILAEDIAGNVSQKSGQIILSNLTIEILEFGTSLPRIAPANPQYQNTVITYNLSKDSIVTVKILKLDGELVKTLVGGESQKAGAQSKIWDAKDNLDEIVVSEGEEITFNYVIIAVDPLTSDTIKASGNIVVDYKGPEAPVLNPIPPYTNKDEITVSGTAELGATVQISIGDSPAGEVTASTTTGEFSLSNVSLSEGMNRITALALDSVANKSEVSDSFDVQLDKTPPVTVLDHFDVQLDKTPPEIITKYVPEGWQNGSVTVYLKAIDEEGGSGVKETHYTIDVSTPTLSSPKYTDEEGVKLSEDGAYLLKFISQDNAGNIESVKQAANYIRIDKTLPTIQINPHEEEDFFEDFFEDLPIIIISGIANDETKDGKEGSGVKLVEIQIQEKEPSEEDWLVISGTSNWLYSFIPEVIPEDGIYNVFVRATDNAGNQNKVEKYDFISLEPESLELKAMPISGGRIRLTWKDEGGKYQIYRSNSPGFIPDDSNLEDEEYDEEDDDWKGVWIDSKTTDQTEYYYKIGRSAQDAKLQKEVSAIADKTSPAIENISATPNSFSPNNDGVDDITIISFTLTEETFVTLRIYATREGDIPDLNKLKWELVGLRPAGDNLVEWNGRDNNNNLVDEDTYVYVFEKAGTLDRAGNVLLQDISGTITCILAPPLEVTILEAQPNPFSPNGDKINDAINLNYTISDFADYVAVNIFDTSGGSQGEIIASLKAEAFEYYFDGEQWVPIHFEDGIPPGRSDENYYLRPVDPKNATPPLFGILDRPGDAQTVDDYLANYQAHNPNWRPVPFTIQWNGGGATDSGAYVYQIAAAKSSGISSVGKTGVILLEGLVVVPDDKTPPIVVRTYPQAGVVHSDKLEYVSADLDDGHGTGVDLTASTIRLIGPSGTVPGRQSNDGIDTITWTLNEGLAVDGSADGIYSISVFPVDHSKNQALNPLFFTFEYNMSITDVIPPVVIDAIVELKSGRLVPLEIGKEGKIEPQEEDEDINIEHIRVTISDKGSGVNLSASSINLLDPTGSVITAARGEDRTNGHLILHNIASLKSDKYKLRVQPVDNADKVGRIVEYVFKYITVTDGEEPQILDTLAFTSEAGSSSLLKAGAFINTPIYSLTIDVIDIAPSSGLDLSPDPTKIRLLDASREIKGGISYENVTQDESFNSVTIRLTLENPLSTDGSDDGDYTIIVQVSDNSENSFESTPVTFQYDTIAPFVRNIIPSPDESILNVLPEISVTLEDNPNGSGIDRDTSVTYILGPDGNRIPAIKKKGEQEGEIILLPPDPSFVAVDGLYTMVAIPKDKAGNEGAKAAAIFRLDTQPPSVISMIPERSSSVNGEVSQIQSTFYDENGMDFKHPEMKLRMLLFSIVDLDLEFQSDLDSNKISENLRQEFENNGISLSDNAAVSIEEEGSRWLITDNHQTYTVRKDEDKLYIYLEIMPTPEAEDFDNSLLLQLTVPLSINGVYTIWGEVADQAGNPQKLEEIKQQPLFFIFDDVAPEISPVFAVSGTGESKLSEGKVINETINKVKVDVSDLTSGMDLKKTKILLKEETGKIVPGILNFYDVNKETTNLNEYTTIEINEYTTIEWTVNDVQALKPGVYKVEVEATDMAQNIAKEEITFGFSPAPQFKPEILSIKPQNEKRFNTPISQVIVVVKDNSGTGINFENSTIRVTGPGGATEDYQSDDGVDMLFWNFANPLATDHSDDGEYVVTVKVVDYASNSTETEITFIYDTVPPQVKTGSALQVSPAPGSVINTADLRKISVTLEDQSGIDLDKSKIQLNGPRGAVDGQKTDNGIDTLIFEFAPLKRDGSDDGRYTIIVTPADKVGNVAKFPLEFMFIYDTSPPLIRTIVPTADSTVVSPIDEISVTLDDGKGSGVDLTTEGSSVQLIRLADPPQIIGGEQSDNGVDTITLSFAKLAADGSENGIYHIEVIPQDNLGNTPESPIIFEFIYTVTAPLLISTTPEANAVLNTPIERVTVVLQDRSGKGMDFSKSNLTLSRLHTLKPPSGVEVSGTLTYTPDTLVLTLSRLLATDGRDDGNYLISVTAADLAESQATYSVPFIYDTLPPVVREVKPTPNEAIKESISQVSATLSDSGAGVDLAKSSITLKGSKGTVSGRQTNDGIDTIKWEFAPLTPFAGGAGGESDDGMYTITVTPVDKIGNKTIIPLEFTFIYDTTPPEITASNPVANTIVPSPIDRVSATLDDGDGSGLDISNSTITVSRVGGEAVEGRQSDNGVDTLLFSFVNPLSADGSDNGVYRIEVTPQDLLGNVPQTPLTLEFIYNTSAPFLISTTPAVGSALNTPIEQVTAVLEDRSGRGLDLLKSNLTLKRGDSDLEGNLTHVQNTLIFTLSRLFATDGTDDDEYTISVTSADLAGGEVTYSGSFIYDTIPPDVNEVRPAPSAILKESVSQVSATLLDSGAGIDLAKSSISLKGPKGAVSGRQTNDGIDTIKWEFAPLTPLLGGAGGGSDDGMYTITVTPVDKIGNKTIIPLEFTFIYDTTPPDIIELNPAAHSTVVSPIDKVSATLDDGDGSGLDISTSTIKVSKVVGETVQAVEGDEQNNGVDTLVFSFSHSLSADGSDNGIYRIEVMPIDNLGNTPESPIIVDFTYNVSAPLLVSTTPAVGSALNAPIEQVTAVLQDRSGRGLDDDLSNLTLKRGEIEVPGSLKNVVASPSVATLISTLSKLFATDGTDDGEYTIQVTAVDLAGSKVSYSVSFTYDTQPPYISDVNPTPNKVTNESISFVSAKLVDEYTGVDLEKSSITLKGPKGTVSGRQTNDGIDTIKWEFTPLGAGGGLDADGIYTIEVVPVDKLGNKAFAPSQFKFIFDTTPPTVSTEPGADAFLTTPISNLSAILDDGIGSGVDLSASRITVSGPAGLIEGTQVNNGINTIIFRFDSPLATDGSADGDYTIEVIAQDILSNVSDQLKFGFEYRPRVPVLVETAPENKAKFNNPIDVVSAVLSDQTDSGLNLAETSITVEGPGVLPEDTTGHNGVDTMFWTFTNPLATDGTDDGEYTVTVTAVTNSGLSVTSKSTFIYDTTAPVVTEITPQDGDILTTSISEVIATLSDAVSLESIGGFDTLRTQPKGFAGVDLDKSTIQLQGPGGSVKGRQTNNGVDTIRWEFAPFVAAEGRRYDGEYTIQVKPRDMLGNSIPISQNFKFKFDTTPPTVVSTAPEDKTIVVSPINRISATLDDANGAGVDFEKSTVRLIGPNGLVKGSISSDGINTIFWDFDAFLASDGTDDGMYTITVTPVDKKNNAAKTALRFGFTYTTKAPGIVSTTPQDEEFLNTALNSVSAVLKDNSGEGLNWEGTTIALTGPDDQPVSGIVDKDDISNTITLIFDSLFAIDGSDDGRYTMTIVAADNTGVKVEYTRKFTYDTIPSSVSKASVLLEDGEVSVDLVADSTKRLNENISEVSAVLFDRGVGVNLVGSTIKLTGPKGTVSGLQTNDGVSLISLKFQPLATDGTDDGLYTVTVTPKDLLGNVAVTEERFDFLYDTTPPRVVRTTPKDREGIVSPIDTVSVVLDDGGGSGIDFVSSRVSLEGPKGLIEGEQSDNELDTIILSFEPLPIDIADGGDYFIHITALDLLSNSKSTVVSFTYKPTAPSIKELSPNDEALLNQPPSEISVILEAQIGTEINLEGSRMQLFNPQGALELGELTHVEAEDRASTLRLKLDVPPATDGSDDGRYTIKITAMDNRGNSVIHTAEFLYDTTAPEVIWTQPENGGILKENISSISAKLKDEHAGVDLIGSTISLSGVKGKQQNNGVDTIKLQFAQLPDDGVYQMTIFPKDVLGNAPPEPIIYSFRLDTTPPTVASTEPPDGAILVNTRLFQIKAALDDVGVRSSPTPGAIAGLTGSGVDLSKSTITLTGPRGKITGEKQTDFNTIIFVLSTPLTLGGADDGKYTIEIVAVDKAGNSAEPFLSSFVYDTIQPGGPKLSNISSLPVSFSPNGDGASDTTRISFALSKRAKVTVSVYNSDSELARTLVDSEEMGEGENSLIWDGTSDNEDVGNRALTLPDGAYTVVFDAKDVDGLTGALESVHVIIDTQPPIISNLAVSNNPFTPDGDGFADLTSISFSVTNSTPQDSITVAIHDAQTRGIVSPRLPIEPMFEGNGNYSATWDGFDTGLAENDGEYIYEVIAKDLANNIRTISGAIMLDRNAPSIEVIEPESAFVTVDQPSLLIIGSATDFSGVRLIEALVSEISPASTSSGSIWHRVMFSGDGIDNDLDGAYDEEEYNQQDDDGDGKTDEDLRAKNSIPSPSGETHPVDYIYKFDPKSDGKYILNIRAMDNVGHITAESDFITVTVVYDTVPPVHLSTSVFKNGKEYAIPPKYKNGDEIKIVSKWDAAGYNVTADFSEIDSQTEVLATSATKVSALDNGDGTYTLQHQISLDNKASEGAKTVRITAVDATSKETVIDTIVLELDNTLPEIISVQPADAVYKNGDFISLTLTCDSANYEVRADFSSVDSTYEPVGTDLKPARTEEVTNNGDKTYTIKYQISDANTRPDAKSLPIAISVFDGVNTRILGEFGYDKSFTAELDNTPPEFTSISAKDKVLSNGITAVLTVTLDEPGYTLLADFSRLDSEYTEGDETLTDNRDKTYTVEYTISKENTREDAKNTLIQFKALDIAGNVKEYSFSVILDNVAPEILGVSSQDKDIIYKNGDTINLFVQTDAAGYNVKADFSFLDSQYEPGGEETDDKGDGTYIVSYTISEGNTKGTEKVLENLPVIIAVSDERHTSSYDAFTLQLDNQPPKIEISSPSGENPVSTTAQIEIRGKTEAGSVGALSPTIKIAPASVESSYDADTGEFSFTLDLKVGETQITLQATDVAGNKTVKELLITYRPIISEVVSATKGAEIILPEEVDDGIADNDTKIIIPPFALPKDVVVSITLVKDALPVPNNPEIAQDNATPLAAYRISLKSADGKDIPGVLSKPATLILQFPAAKEKTKAASLQDISLDIEKLKLFKWDGIYWNKVGGKAQRNNTIIVKVDNISGLFAIFEISEAPQIFKVYPPRPNPFTPNGDGVHDFVEFYFENLQGLEPIIRIYDQRGALVRELTDVGTTSATWDGKDEDGELLELGLYIYQIKVGAKVGGGTVILAR